MMKNYKQLSVAERAKIEILLNNNFTQKEIALQLKRHKSTISREISKRKCPNGYFSHNADLDATVKKKHHGRKKKLQSYKLQNLVFFGLRYGLSPEQISGRLTLESGEKVISYESIYKFIYEDDFCKKYKIYQYLPRGRKKRQKKFGRKVHNSRIPNRVSIHNRPHIVEQRKEFGHWEGDSVIFNNKMAINTMNELKSGFVVFTKLDRKTANLTASAMLNITNNFNVKTITLDNGSEFCNYELLTKNSEVKVYFCDPYSSWQRGANENCNSLLRRYLPKKSNIDNLTQEELEEISNDLNNRPRKRLGFKTPFEVFFGKSYNLLINNFSCT